MRKGWSMCFYLLTVIMLAVSCGGGGDDGGGGGSNIVVPTVTPPSQSLVGTYRLNGFKIIYANGVTVTEKNTTSFSGSMEMGINTLTQTFVINGQSIYVPQTGYSITYTKGTSEGILHLTDPSGTKRDGSFAISGNLFHTYTNTGITDTGLTFEEWDYWEKTSDKIGIVTGMVEEKDALPEFKTIGEILIEKNLIVIE